MKPACLLVASCLAMVSLTNLATAQTFPGQGTDTFATYSPFCVVVAGIPFMGFVAVDPATVASRSNPIDETGEGALPVPTGACTACSPTVSDADINCWPGGAGGPAVRREVHTEMLALAMVGQFGVYQVEYLAGQPAFNALQAVGQAAKYRNTFGEVESNDLTGNPANDFPATSHWAVNGVVRITPPPGVTSGVFYTMDPVLMIQRVVNGFPPPPDVYYNNEQGTVMEAAGAACGLLPVNLFDAVTDLQVGIICGNNTHRPYDPDKPNRAESDPDAVIGLGGSTGGAADPGRAFHFAVRNAAHQPIAGTQVELRFQDCPNLVIAADQTYPGVTLASCSPPVVHATTDANGIATFVVAGSAPNRGALQPALPCAMIYAGDPGDQVYLGDVPVAAYDQDGVNGLSANDLSLLLEDFGGGYYQRSDYDGNGSVSSSDVSAWLAAYLDGGSQQTPQRCDAGPIASGPDVLSGGLRLAWNDCRGGGGVGLRTSACGSNSGSNILVGSILLPSDVSDVTGIETTIDVYGNFGEALPDWWHLEQAGCRSNASSISFDFSGGPFGCLDPWLGQAVGGFRWDPPAQLGGMHRVRHRLVSAVAPAGGFTLPGGQEMSLFRLNLSNIKTTGAGSCTGCNKPMAVVLYSVRLTRPPGMPDKLLYAAESEASQRIAYWQGVPTGFTTGVGESDRTIRSARLDAALPNPSAGPFTIGYALPQASRVALTIYDLTGRRVRELLNGPLPAGEHTVIWDGRTDRGVEAAAGVYLYRLRTGEDDLQRTLVKIR